MKPFIKTALKWLFLSLLIGLLGGAIGALFAHTIAFVTELRQTHGYIIYALPVGGLLSVAVYQLLKVQSVGTNQVLEGIRSPSKVSSRLTPAIFIGSVISHLLGASAGREGAALQLGGGLSAFLSKLFKLNEKDGGVLTVCGMAAFFSALFGTPQGAIIFALEVVSIGSVCLSAAFPTAVAGFTAYAISGLCGVTPERFSLPELSVCDLNLLWRTAVIAAACAVVGMLFCHSLHLTEKLFLKYLKNSYLRISVGGAVILALTLLVGNNDYNGSGLEVIHGVFSGDLVGWESFLLKLIFTCVTVAAGFKGGEIVPSFFIGASLGCAMSGALGLDPSLGAAVGMTVLFGSVTNCPFAALVLAAELFDGKGVIYLVAAVIISLLMSGNIGLYRSHTSLVSKLFSKK